MNSSDSTLPNPHSPMVYLPPVVAESFMISANINLFTMGVLVWDWAMSIPDEYRILSIGRRLSSSKITYFCSRVFNIAACLCACIIYVLPVSDCHALSKSLTAFIVLALNTNNLLFFYRVRAVYGNSRGVTFFFGSCYMVVCVTSCFVPSTLDATHIGPTAYCINSEIKPWLSALSVVFNAVNDTLVFLAISYRIASTTMGAKELLQNGQLGYLSTVVLNMTQIILGFTTEYGTLIAMPVVAIQHIMTCRVHRAVILGLITSKQPPNLPVMLTTFIPSVDTSTTDDRLDAKKPLELQEGELAWPAGAV
ncbi:hypothetical protein FIBSPDRAFT_1038860 [Athelia psychrophila]|uniref:Uncharacterized protein n=1 Tax=Athelia psychrophila TaxID=1759441 RepID=A0A166SJP5_9AGAM|nr:hypothetical protein FIBSPDRAFT_1038860 [Fibularhizoctonia sp. CBS 109695]